jgi:hypothetical protein
LEWAEKNLIADELENKLLARDCNGRIPWHWTEELVRVKVLLKQWAKRKLTTEEINNEILVAKDNDGKTVWHMAAGMENEDLLHELWVWAKEALTTEEIKNSLFFHSGHMDTNCWHTSVKSCGLESLLDIWE